MTNIWTEFQIRLLSNQFIAQQTTATEQQNFSSSSDTNGCTPGKKFQVFFLRAKFPYGF
jgi:hypothetical protein